MAQKRSFETYEDTEEGKTLDLETINLQSFIFPFDIFTQTRCFFLEQPKKRNTVLITDKHENELGNVLGNESKNELDNIPERHPDNELENVSGNES